MFDKLKSFFAKLTLIPQIITYIQTLESIIPIPSAGKSKLDLIIAMISSVYQTEAEIQKLIPFSEIETLIRTVATLVVSSLNSLGVFKKAIAS